HLSHTLLTTLLPYPTLFRSADEHQLQQVLLNLVQNAHQAMAKQATLRVLTVRISVRSKCAVLAVLDNGAGIATEALPRVFDPFLDRKSTRLNSSHVAISYAV